jgi:large subunit ribosomal protein L10
MPTPEKIAAVGELTQKLQRSKMAVLTDYRGLTVRDLATLRRQLGPAEVEYEVAKNTLLRLAARNSGVEGADDLLAGPTAVAFCYGDIVAPAKTLTDFARTTRVLNVRGAVLDGRLITPEDVTRLGALPPAEQLRAEVVGAIGGPLAGFVGVLNGLLQTLVGTLEARGEQLGGAEGAEGAEGTAA